MHTVLFPHIVIVLAYLPIEGLSKDFAVFFGGVLGSIVITLVLRRFTPKSAALLFGGR